MFALLWPERAGKELPTNHPPPIAAATADRWAATARLDKLEGQGVKEAAKLAQTPTLVIPDAGLLT